MSKEDRNQSKCKSCRYFDPVDILYGFCKVESPRMTSSGDATWPLVPSLEWCGKHRPFFEVVKTPLGAYMKPVEENEEESEGGGHSKSCPARMGSTCNCGKL